MIGFDRPQRVRTVVTDHYRMSLRHGEDWHELYDLKEDPHELQNLYGAPASEQVRFETTDIMLRRMIDLQDRAPLAAYRA